MKTRFPFSWILHTAWVVCALALASAPRLSAQVAPRTLDAVQEISPEGGMKLTISMSFDAAPWKSWKSQVGDEPARLRAMMKHQFSALALDGFKLEKDEENRTARMILNSASGPELRKDGSFRVPIEKYFRLVNQNGREWFFSGNNPHAGNSLNTVKLVLPENARDATLTSAGTVDQGIIFRVERRSGHASTLVLAGGVILALGVVLLVGGLVLKAKPATPAA